MLKETRSATCSNCVYKRKNVVDKNINAQICVRFPPTTNAIPIGRDTVGGISIANAVSYPGITNDTYACGEYKEKLGN